MVEGVCERELEKDPMCTWTDRHELFPSPKYDDNLDIISPIHKYLRQYPHSHTTPPTPHSVRFRVFFSLSGC